MHGDTMFHKLRYPIESTRRPYTIHINMSKDCTSKDILSSYYLARLIDNNLQKALKHGSELSLESEGTGRAIRRAEWEFLQIDFEKDIEEPMIANGWKLEFIYLDPNTNRFQI